MSEEATGERKLSPGLSGPMQRDLYEQFAKPSIQDFLAMSPIELAVWTQGAAEGGSVMDEFYKKLLAAKVGDQTLQALASLERATISSNGSLTQATHDLAAATTAGNKALEEATKELAQAVVSLDATTHKGHESVKHATYWLVCATVALFLATAGLVWFTFELVKVESGHKPTVEAPSP